MSVNETTAEGRRFLPKFVRKWLNPLREHVGDVGEDVTQFDVVKRLETEIGFTNLKKLHKHIKEKEKAMLRIDNLREEIAKKWIKTSYFKDYDELKKELKHLTNPPNSSNRKIRLNDRDIELPYPTIQRISPNASVSYDAAYIQNERYWIELTNALEKHVKSLNLNSDLEIMGHALRKINSLTTKAKTASVNFGTKSKQFLGEGKSDEGIKELLTEIESHKTELLKKKFTSKEVEFAHTYRVIRPLTSEQKQQLLAGGFGNWSGTSPDEIGLDENGWPLEVNNSGEVLIDKFLKNGKNRKIPDPENWSVDCDAIDIANWLYSEYDAYICDLRDGRNHPQSVSVFDWIMTDLNLSHVPHPNSRGNLRNGKQAIVRIPKHGGPYEDMPLQPTHLNPAFDLRSNREIPFHKGRVYYYDSQEYCVPSDEPMISSRGAALYIVHMCIQHIKYVDNQPFSKGVLDTLSHISKSTEGLDLGKNIDDFAKEFKNPFAQ